MNLTTDILHQTMPKAGRPWLEAMVTELPKAGIDTPREVASFVAQIAHESNELTHLEENLNYSAERLMAVWPKRFPSYAIAQKYEHMPEKLANYVYASRMGNGDPDSGDGWAHRGVGPLQITGKHNQTACAEALGIPIERFHGELLLPFNGIRSACWFWKTHNLDALDNDNDVRAETRRINGGENGLAHRQAYFDKCLKLLGGT